MLLTELAHAKINWFLNILGPRPDDYHELLTLMQEISLCDRLILTTNEAEAKTWQEQKPQTLDLTYLGLNFHFALQAESLSLDENNTVIRAVKKYLDNLSPEALSHLARNRYYLLVEKSIPQEAGLGGGSADAAACLRLLQSLVRNLNLSPVSAQQLAAIALQIGADVPFCLHEAKAALCTGVGELITPYNLTSKNLPILLVKPHLAIKTKEAFALYKKLSPAEKQALPQTDLAQLAQEAQKDPLNLSKLQELLHNDFFYLNPFLQEIARALVALLPAGADYLVKLSGSGPSSFLILSDPDLSRVYLEKLRAASRQEGPLAGAQIYQENLRV